MLALLLLAQHALGRDTSKDTFIVKQIDVCPDVGYFFKRDLNSNNIEPSCHLCFCQNNGTAVCWSRENRRCDDNHYYHVGKKKRSRRSPGFSDVFFRDATRDIFNKQIPEQCKPFESSFSEGCPPADWCTGCTVCDCDANGRWDCHILSFCPDSKGKKQMKKRRGRLRNKIQKRQLPKTKTNIKTTKKPTRKPLKPTQKYPPIKKHGKGINEKKPQKKQNKVIKKKQKKTQKGKPKKYTQQLKQKPKFQKKNFTKNKTKFVKKTKPKKSITYKSNKGKDKRGKHNTLKTGKVKDINHKNDSTVKFAQTFLKKVMASVEKIVTESQKNLVRAKQPKNIQKRSMSKNYRNGIQKNSNDRHINKVQSKIINKINTKTRNNLSKKKAAEKMIIRSRRKREITGNETKKDNTFIYLTTISNTTTTTRNDYYKYEVDLKNISLTKNNNSITTDINDKPSSLDTVKNTTIITVTEKSLIFNKSQITLSSLNIDKNNQSIFGAKPNYNNSTSITFLNNTKHKEYLQCGTFCDVRKTLKTFLGISNKINKTRTKANHSTILSNIKKIFKKIFLKTKVNTRSFKIEKVPFRKRNIIKLLCKSINNCKINHTNKKLQYKLERLRSEGLNILRSARIVKGLLRLLNKENTKTNNTVTIKQFNDNDVEKLNLILRDEFEAQYGLVNITETQQTQIKYIKENTYVMICSIEKFAHILNDIINTLAYGNKHVASHRYTSKYRIIKENRNDIVANKLEKLKNLLINYKLVQNKFLKRMYNVLNTLENKTNMTSQIKVNKVSAQNQKINHTIAIENYTKSIFENLRKLKDLAVRLNSKTRKKRAIREEDDVLEYLLMLMEYLFKQNQPLGVLPVNDEIDLLIEAIKNAPDIKSIKKKVLNKDLIPMRKTNTAITADNETAKNNATSNKFENKLRRFESIDEEHEELNKSINTNLNQKNYQDSNIIDDLHKELKSNDSENNNLDEKLLNIDKDVKKYEIFIDDTDEDESFPDTTTAVETEAPITEPTRTLSPDEKDIKSTDYERNYSKHRIKLEWVEENFNNNESEKLTQSTDTTTQMSQLLTRTVKVNDKYSDPVSSMSQEETGLKNKDDSLKRQLNLLNSIDYGTEKSFIDSESKEDKYNVESSPMYFV